MDLCNRGCTHKDCGLVFSSTRSQITSRDEKSGWANSGDINASDYAIIAALHSQVNVSNINQKNENDRKIKIKSGLAFYTHGDHFEPAMLQITVTNIGTHTVVVECPYLRLPSGAKLSLHGVDGAHNFPARLDDGSNVSIFADLNEIAAELENLLEPVK